MDTKEIWLIYHKASLNPNTPMNMDGSTYAVGIIAAPGKDLQDALVRFHELLKSNHMELLDLWKCIKHNANDYGLANEDPNEIERAIHKAQEHGKAFYACGLSSEVLAAQGIK
ncbi:hypothetical protein HCH_02297 [Hahella chejuensis KCTC 2396]|uniref:Uncharacterized protein n=1 Tax=Hahella chejuensis (strain KCTC 2396) TaxID=349521 RepID=Q2SJQ4_HAHCH|nr:hypothetical protein [Hahella chejuensis]ABC29120.1 hypothetical protein HCH_02297 [Hahella chejuensis KCTC 2396]